MRTKKPEKLSLEELIELIESERFEMSADFCHKNICHSGQKNYHTQGTKQLEVMEAQISVWSEKYYQKAITILEAKADTYQTAYGEYYITWRESRCEDCSCLTCENCGEPPGCLETNTCDFYNCHYEDSGDETYCKNCIDKAVEEFKKEHPNRIIEVNGCSTSGETDDFDYCEGCGIIFQKGCLCDTQEIEHFFGLADEELKLDNLDAEECYRLLTLFDGVCGSIMENYIDYEDYFMMRQIAEKLINVNPEPVE